jgi:hypothetical protein
VRQVRRDSAWTKNKLKNLLAAFAAQSLLCSYGIRDDNIGDPKRFACKDDRENRKRKNDRAYSS